MSNPNSANPNPPPYNPNNPNNSNNNNNNNRRLPSAWQPTAPTSSLQTANVGQSYYPPPQAYVPQGYVHPHQQQGYNPHAQPRNPYYAQHQYYQPQPPHTPLQHTQAQQTPVYQPPARERRALVITDKNGNPIDLGTKRPTNTTAGTPSAAAAAAAATPTTTTTAATKPATESSESAGLKLKEAALARIAETDAKKKEAALAEELAKKKAAEEEAAAAAAAKKLQEEEEEAAARKKAEEEQARQKEEDDKKKAEEEAAAARKLEEEKAASTGSTGKRRVYSKVDLLRFRELDICCCRPPELPDMTIEKGPARSGSINRGNGAGGGRGDGSNSWSRGQTAPPNRRQSGATPQQAQSTPQGGGGGGQWSRGQAPPPPPKQNQQPNNNKGGRGNNRGYVEASFDFEPLVKNENRWRPQKNVDSLALAEKKVKSILNKMTKEKFGRLSEQMCEIPLESYETLNMMIRLVYEKAIDEPAFGDMYADLCVLLSQTAQSHTSSYVHFIESDEEWDNGSPVVWRWSNDVSHNDAEIVGPFQSEDTALAAALAESTSEPIQRGEMALELVRLKISERTFIKVLKKVKATKDSDEDPEQGEVVEADDMDEYYIVFFPVEQAQECGQTMSAFFLTERECRSDASKNNSFKRSLLNQCQDEFNKQDIFEDWKKEKAAYEGEKEKLTEAERKEKEEELNFRKIKIKKQMLGNIKFIGQLYKKGLLKEKIMRHCISSLLKLEEDKIFQSKNPEFKDTGDTDLDEEDHEALGNMFATIGKTIDTPQARYFMNVCFTKMTKFSDDKTLTSRVRFMYKDLIDLRDSGWIPRRKEEKAKTLDEIRKDVEREERMQEQQRVTYGGSGGRGGGRGGGGGTGAGRSSLRNSGIGGRATYDSNSRRPTKQVQTDEDGFTTVAPPRAGAPSTRTGRGRDSFNSTSTPVNDPPARSSISTTPAGKSPPPPVKVPVALTKEKLELRIDSIRSEYMQDPNNLQELLLSVEELSGTPGAYITFVQRNADRAMDCKDDERKAIVSLIALLFEKKKLSQDDVGGGMADIVEFIDSLVLDSPKAFEYLGDMLATMLNVGAVDVTWLVEQTEKTKLSDASVPERVIKETMVAFVGKFGKDNAQSTFGDGADKFAELLGNDKWNAVASSILD